MKIYIVKSYDNSDLSFPRLWIEKIFIDENKALSFLKKLQLNPLILGSKILEHGLEEYTIEEENK